MKEHFYTSFCQVHHSFIHSFIMYVVCLTTGVQPLPQWLFLKVRSTASCFSFRYPLVPIRSSGNFLRLIHHLIVTYILPSIFPSITCSIGQFLRQMRPIHLAVHLSFYVGNSYSLWFSAIVHFLQDISEFFRCFWSTFRSVQFSHNHKIQCYKFNISLIFSLNLIPVCRWKESSSCSTQLLSWQSWI